MLPIPEQSNPQLEYNSSKKTASFYSVMFPNKRVLIKHYAYS